MKEGYARPIKEVRAREMIRPGLATGRLPCPVW
jgi:hypothetical protein